MTSKVWVVLGFMGLSFVVGMMSQYYYPGVELSPVDMWFLPAFSVLLFLWYRIDSEQRSYKRSRWLNIGIIAIAIVALPYYLIRSRGLKNGAIATGAMILLLLLSGALTFAGEYSAHYVLHG